MRRFHFWAGFAVLFACCFLAYRHAHGTAPAICIEVQEDGGLSGGADYLPAVNGYSTHSPGKMSASNGPVVRYQVSKSYKVATSSPGSFFVLAHYVIERPGQSEEVDRAIPVTGHNDATAGWTKLDDHLNACAYQSGSAISY